MDTELAGTPACTADGQMLTGQNADTNSFSSVDSVDRLSGGPMTAQREEPTPNRLSPTQLPAQEARPPP
eukprot:scaffold66983_cov14-Prasinocladus_malaysianus.AAC.1